MTSEALRPQLSVTMKQLKLAKSVLQHERSETVTLRRPHLHVVNASPTIHTVSQEAVKVSSSSDEILEGNDMRRLKIATKYQTETSET